MAPYRAWFPSSFGVFEAWASSKGVVEVRLLLLTQEPPLRPNRHTNAFGAALKRYLSGISETFLGVEVDYLQLPTVRIALYERVRQIPYGHTASYASLARELSLSPRAVGAAMRACPLFPIVPAQRVIHADGRLGGFMGREGLKQQLLNLEAAGRS